VNPSQIPIRDIKPLLPIPDVSFYIFTALIAVGVLIVAAGTIYVWRRWHFGRKSDPRISWVKRLEQMDFSDAKRSAYLMTKYGRLLAEDKRRQEIMAQLLPKLERYKYKKRVPPLDEETKRFMKLFIEMSKDAL